MTYCSFLIWLLLEGSDLVEAALRGLSLYWPKAHLHLQSDGCGRIHAVTLTTITEESITLDL